MAKKQMKAEEILRAAFGVKKRIREAIKQEEIKKGEKITKEEKAKIVKREENKYKKKKFIAAVLLSVGIATTGATALPSAAQEESKITGEATSERENFVRDLQVEPKTLDVVNVTKEIEDIRNYLKEEIGSLEDEEAVLAYLKEFYINEYNADSLTYYTPDQVEFKRTRELNPEWVLHARINDNGNISELSAYKEYSGCHACDVHYREITDIENDFIANIAPTISAGISRMASMNNPETSRAQREKYENDFIDEMTNYLETSKGVTYNRIMHEIQEKANEGNEIGD